MGPDLFLQMYERGRGKRMTLKKEKEKDTPVAKRRKDSTETITQSRKNDDPNFRQRKKNCELEAETQNRVR